MDVAGRFGEEPTVRIAAPLRVSTSQTQVALLGDGAQIQIDQLFVLGLTIYNARTGDKVASTADTGNTPLVAKSSDGTLFPALVTAVAGKPQGSRVVLALVGSDAYAAVATPPTGVEPNDPVVVVADVLAVPPATSLARAQGEQQLTPPGTPVVRVLAGDPTAIDVLAGVPSPSKVTVVPLIRGTGDPVRKHSLVTVKFLGQDWGSSQPFASTYFKEPAVVPVEAEGSVPAWDQALVGLPAGSRVLVIDPDPQPSVPGEAKPQDHETIAWVIDVLGVS